MHVLDATPCWPGPEEVARLDAFCEAGLFLQAHADAQAFGPLESWEPIDARLLAARLARHLGAPQLAKRLALLAYRRAPEDGRARYYHAIIVLSERGLLEAWLRLTAQELPKEAPGAHRADLLTVR